MNKAVMYECSNCMFFVYHSGSCPNCGRLLIKSPKQHSVEQGEYD